MLGGMTPCMLRMRGIPAILTTVDMRGWPFRGISTRRQISLQLWDMCAHRHLAEPYRERETGASRAPPSRRDPMVLPGVV